MCCGSDVVGVVGERAKGDPHLKLIDLNSHASERPITRCAPPASPSSVQVLIFLLSQAESVPVEPFQPQPYP
jgi:hypothetical protein